MGEIKVITSKFIRSYETPIGLSMDKQWARVNVQPALWLYITDEKEIDLVIDRLLEIRKQYTDEKYKRTNG